MEDTEKTLTDNEIPVRHFDSSTVEVSFTLFAGLTEIILIDVTNPPGCPEWWDNQSYLVGEAWDVKSLGLPTPGTTQVGAYIWTGTVSFPPPDYWGEEASPVWQGSFTFLPYVPWENCNCASFRQEEPDQV